MLENTDTEEDEAETSRKASEAAEHITSMIITIPHELGLDAQDFRCPMCRKSIGAVFSKFGVCGIDGLYYCADCMRPGGEMPIPSRVLRSWDWKPRPVSDRGRAFIEANQSFCVIALLLQSAMEQEDTPVIRIDQHNPTLYDHVPMLRTMKMLREQLQIASMYLFNCRESIADDFRRRVWPREHLYNDIHAYSISDLLLLHNGQLEKQVRGFLKHAVDHVMHCSLCRQKGFICEICEANEDLLLLHNGQLEKQVRGFLKHAVDHVMHCSLCRQKGFICEICEANEVIYPFETERTYRC
ncbi:unnamed protein product [Cylicostephanus goldi]|uniref:Rubicon Homology domain-containing protein n=1 Tax=Cylicostephanus goldi TaxID=71465 RepID=A0A3P7M2F5_CYLGO|nr:unnamed protein product [Cylicostephanus goldi]